MNFEKPVIVYTAATSVEAQMIVELLQASGVPALAADDQSGVGLWVYGTSSQIQQPNIWVDEATSQKAADLIRDFEEKKRSPSSPVEGAGEMQVICEDCGGHTSFPSSLDGTTQECRHCGAYVDVGNVPWDDDCGESND